MNILKLLTSIDSKSQENFRQSVKARSLFSNSIRLGSATLITFLFLGQKAFAAPTIAPQFSNIFYMNDDITPNIRGMYIAYQITNDGIARDDVWAQIDVPTFGSGANITLGQNEDGLVQLGPMAANETKTAFFYLDTPVAISGNNGSLPITDSHNLTLYDTRPDRSGATSIGSTAFSFVEIQDTIAANSNTVDTVVTAPNPAELGGVITVTVTGNTGTVGSSREMAFSPATFAGWPGDVFELFESRIEFARSGEVYDNTLSFTYTSTQASDYTATYKFRAVNTINQPTPVSPVGEIASGGQIKHTDTSGFGSLSAIQPPQNNLTLTQLASESQLDNGGIVTYTLRLNNTGSTDVVVQEIQNTLPTDPGVVNYVPGQATYNGTVIEDPTISGSTLSWVGSFAVPAGTSRDLTFQATIPDTDGNYVNSAIAFIDDTQIDSTLDTADNAPATIDINVGSPELDYGDAPSSYRDASHEISSSPSLYLGSVVPDSETATQTTSAASAGDDDDGNDDEDAFVVLPNVPLVDPSITDLSIGRNYNLTVPVTNNTGAEATLHAWIDFDRDGQFEAGEYQSATVANGATSVNLNWDIANILGLDALTVPLNTLAGDTHARFRLTSDNLTDETTLIDPLIPIDVDDRSFDNATNGEVEDYPISIAVPLFDYGDAPDTGTGTATGNYQTTESDEGPTHIVIQDPLDLLHLSLGNTVDGDDGSLQNENADADDLDTNNVDLLGTLLTDGDTGLDDEDGVDIDNLPTLTADAGQTYTVPVTVRNNVPLLNAYLVGYIDFNQDGDFEDPGEKSATVTVPSDLLEVTSNSVSLDTTGDPRTFNVTFTVPAGVTPGDTYARFRLGSIKEIVESATTITVTTDNGEVNNGEVEDYGITIGSDSSEITFLSGQLVNDINNNGIQEEGEIGIDNAIVRLFKQQDGQLQATTTTEHGGFYRFDNLPPDEYYIEIETPIGNVLELSLERTPAE